MDATLIHRQTKVFLSFAKLDDVSTSSASALGREVKAEEFLMPISDLWKVVKHRDNTIYLSYRTLMRTENLDNVATTKGKRKCSL